MHWRKKEYLRVRINGGDHVSQNRKKKIEIIFVLFLRFEVSPEIGNFNFVQSGNLRTVDSDTDTLPKMPGLFNVKIWYFEKLKGHKELNC